MKNIDVLGMQFTDYPLKEAMNLSLKYTSNGALNTIFYVSSQVLLDAGENQQQKEWLESMDLILYGEPTVLDVLGENTRERKNEINQDKFLHEFIKKIARAKQGVFLIAESKEQGEALKAYLQSLHENVNVVDTYVWVEGESKAEDLVNELNDYSPDIIISKLPNPVQQKLICENRRMINSNVWIALLYERVLGKRKKASFGLKLDWLFYKRLFRRKVNKYETEKAETETEEAVQESANELAAADETSGTDESV